MVEEIPLELDDEIIAWLEATSLTLKKPVEQLVAEFIRDQREVRESADPPPV